MGSGGDAEHVAKITKYLNELGIPFEQHVASAHKTPQKLLGILKKQENGNIVYITVAGRSDALSAFTDFHSSVPVIACPPQPKPEDYLPAYLSSTVDTPSGVGVNFHKHPESAAIAAAKILGQKDENILKRLEAYKMKKSNEVEDADTKMRTM